jgi:hypothetical protein
MKYFDDLDSAISLLSGWSKMWAGGVLRTSHITPHLMQLRRSMQLLRSRFAFEVNDPLVIDLSLSGFPNSYMFAKLAVDEERCKEVSLMSTMELKQIFLDSLMSSGEVNTSLLNAVSEALYRDALARGGDIFDVRFVQGEIALHKAETKNLYHVHWLVYDAATNVPAVFGMVFQYEGKDVRDIGPALWAVLKFESRSDISVARIAGVIDTDVHAVRPKYLSRAKLGPMYVPDFTTREGIWPAIASTYGDTSGVLVEIIVDHTYAEEMKKPSSLAATLGLSSRPRQVFAIERTQKLCYERGASAVEQMALVPHDLFQKLDGVDAHYRDVVQNTKIYPYNKKGELL